jgi:putative hydrolase of the HAD superfamily
MHGADMGGFLSLRAVIFDYGMVLTGQPNANAHDAMVRITGLPRDQFETIYWADRRAYDATIDALNAWDARMWTTQNPAMLAWQMKLKQHGIRTAILSNMGDTVLASIQREFDWLPRFDVLIWSFEHKMAKPDAAIYRLTLDKLGTRPEETLFIDDKQANIDAARDLGLLAIQFSTIERLREDMIAAGLDKYLPLPESRTTV